MKRYICYLLVLSIILSFCACTSKEIDNPIPFYYLRKNFSFGSEDSMIAPEIVDGTQFSSLSFTLSAYLRGPSDLALKSPFPAGTFLLGTDVQNNTLVITLSDNFASLTGVELTVACCALAKTAIAFTDVECVKIKAVTALLDGDASITIQESDIVLYDDYSAATDNTE